MGRPGTIGLNRPSAFKLPLSLTLTGLVGGDPVLSARAAINEILRQMINYGSQKSVRRELNLTRGKTLI